MKFKVGVQIADNNSMLIAYLIFLILGFALMLASALRVSETLKIWGAISLTAYLLVLGIVGAFVNT